MDKIKNVWGFYSNFGEGLISDKINRVGIDDWGIGELSPVFAMPDPPVKAEVLQALDGLNYRTKYLLSFVFELVGFVNAFHDYESKDSKKFVNRFFIDGDIDILNHKDVLLSKKCALNKAERYAFDAFGSEKDLDSDKLHRTKVVRNEDFKFNIAPMAFRYVMLPDRFLIEDEDLPFYKCEVLAFWIDIDDDRGLYFFMDARRGWFGKTGADENAIEWRKTFYEKAKWSNRL